MRLHHVILVLHTNFTILIIELLQIDKKMQMIFVAQRRPNYIDEAKPPCNCEETIGIVKHTWNALRATVECETKRIK